MLGILNCLKIAVYPCFKILVQDYIEIYVMCVITVYVLPRTRWTGGPQGSWRRCGPSGGAWRPSGQRTDSPSQCPTNTEVTAHVMKMLTCTVIHKVESALLLDVDSLDIQIKVRFSLNTCHVSIHTKTQWQCCNQNFEMAEIQYNNIGTWMKVKHSNIQNATNLFRPKQRAGDAVEVVLFLRCFPC